MAYHRHLDRLRAERLLDAAQAAAIPALTPKARAAWYRATEQRARRRLLTAPLAVGQVMDTDGQPAYFTVNGEPVGKDGLKRWLVQQFGGTSLDARATRASLSGNGHQVGQGRTR